MELEEQLTSLQPSKKLKELGVKQDSIHGWRETISMKGINTWILCNNYDIFVKDKNYSAFSVAELGNILPYLIFTKCPQNMCAENMELVITKTDDGWSVKYHGTIYHPLHTEHSKKLSDAMALMLIYLLKNKLIKLDL